MAPPLIAVCCVVCQTPPHTCNGGLGS
jgi:hypothetical protein